MLAGRLKVRDWEPAPCSDLAWVYLPGEVYAGRDDVFVAVSVIGVVVEEPADSPGVECFISAHTRQAASLACRPGNAEGHARRTRAFAWQA